jgi:hypothetical protein
MSTAMKINEYRPIIDPIVRPQSLLSTIKFETDSTKVILIKKSNNGMIFQQDNYGDTSIDFLFRGFNERQSDAA